MYKKNILDCTLRDGGYINNWGFSYKMTKSILKALVDARIDFIECGYISDRLFKGIESTYFNSFEEINTLVKQVFETTSDSFRPKLCIMLNRGEHDIASFPENTKENYVNTIRVTFHRKEVQAAFEDIKTLIAKGYDVFVQPMVTQLYTDRELLDMIELFNSIDCKAMYIVDSFGNMKTETFKRLLYLFNNNMREDIKLGYHSHNNLQLAFTNAIAFLQSEIKRDIFLDSSIFGMGRGAGNLNTELVADYMNDHYGVGYSVEPLLETMDAYLHKLHQTNFWGYSIEHYLSATLNCHPSSATYLLQKKNLTIVDIRKILGALPDDVRNKFSREELQKYVLEFLSKNKSEPNVKLDKELKGKKNFLLIASGSSVNKNLNKIAKEQTESPELITVALNHIPNEVTCDYYFFSNQKRYKEFEVAIETKKLAVSSNIELNSAHKDVAVLDFADLYDAKVSESRNICILFLNYLSNLGAEKVQLAGLDGYNVQSEQTYSYDLSAAVFDKEMMLKENSFIKEALSNFSEKIDISFITPSIFTKDIPLKICGVIPARYNSSRFEGKPLALIAGVPMLKRTYEQAQKSKQLTKLVVATDSELIYDYCISENMNVVMTSESCLTGTDRVSEVSLNRGFDLYVNIQGDEPVVDPKNIDAIVSAFREHGTDYIAYNLYKKMDSSDEPQSVNSIKVIVNEKDELMFMSRLPVPYSKSDLSPLYNKQVCVYGFTKDALDVFSKNKKTINEKFEDIEILRFIDLGFKVKMIETQYDSIAVDVPEDIIKVESFLVRKTLNN